MNSKSLYFILAIIIAATASPSLRADALNNLQITRRTFSDLHSDSCVREAYDHHWKSIKNLHEKKGELPEEEATLLMANILENIHQNVRKCPVFVNATSFDWLQAIANITGTAIRLGSCYSNMYSIQMDYEYGLKRFPADYSWYVDILLNAWRAVGDCKDFVQVAAGMVEDVSKMIGTEVKLPKYDELLYTKGNAKKALETFNTVMIAYSCLHDAFWSAAMLGMDITTYLSFPNKVVTTRLTLGSIMNAYRANTECRQAIGAIF